MESSENEKPPVFRQWSSWYWLLMIVLFSQVVAYSIITFLFS